MTRSEPDVQQPVQAPENVRCNAAFANLGLSVPCACLLGFEVHWSYWPLQGYVVWLCRPLRQRALPQPLVDIPNEKGALTR